MIQRKAILCSFLLCLRWAHSLSFEPVYYGALGDSYAAGDGAGKPIVWPPSDAGCGRFAEGYPYQLLANDEVVFEPHWPHFENKACGGATSQTAWTQLPLKNKNLVTLQFGGNEVEFFPVLNECIQQWHPLSSCQEELKRARELIQSSQFVERYNSMVSSVMAWFEGFETYILVLGYARFFNEESVQCNRASFSLTDPSNLLTQELRHSLNELVAMLNNVIQSSAEAKGLLYVNIDDVFQGHRFCEENVTEPKPDWDGTWFFRETPRKHGTRGGSRASSSISTIQNAQKPIIDQSHFDDYADLTRAFHPTSLGHKAIAARIVALVKEYAAKRESPTAIAPGGWVDE